MEGREQSLFQKFYPTSLYTSGTGEGGKTNQLLKILIWDLLHLWHDLTSYDSYVNYNTTNRLGSNVMYLIISPKINLSTSIDQLNNFKI